MTTLDFHGLLKKALETLELDKSLTFFSVARAGGAEEGSTQ